jgi:hypothetical protein
MMRREVFTSLLTQKLCSNQSLSAHMISTFNRIRILDAIVFQLPDHFTTGYQGSGGSSNTAGVKIQLEDDLLNGLREVFPTVPVTVEYSLSEKGADFQNVLHAMEVWGEKWN